MARPNAVGISYFPLDTSFLRNIKVRRVLKACGAGSIAVIIALLSEIYEDKGYYLKLNEDLPFLIADEVGITEGATKEIINKLIQVGFFDKKLFNEFKILTSKGIQDRYLKACERRKEVEIIKEYSLINEEYYNNLVNVYINSIDDNNNSINVYESTQSKVKERKEKESKGNKTPPLYSKLPNKGGGVLNNDDVDVEKLKKLISLYNYCGFQNISPSIQDTLVEFSKQYPYSWLEEAFKIATNGGKLSLNYIKGILNRWQTNGKDSDFKNKKTDVESYYDQVDKWTEEIERERANNGH